MNANAQTGTYEEILEKIATKVTIAKGAWLPRENIYYLLEGICALTYLTKDGLESSYLYFRPGMLLGFLPHIMDNFGVGSAITLRQLVKLEHTIQAKTQCQCLRVNGKVFMEFIENNPRLFKLLAMSAAENLVNVLSISTDIAALSAGARVCQVILDFMEEKPPYRLPHYLTYNEIAVYLAMHVITVTKIFKVLREQGIIEKRGRTSMIIDKARLVRIVKGEEELHY